MTSTEKWHRKIDHVNFNYLNVSSKYKIVDGIPNEFEQTQIKCAIVLKTNCTVCLLKITEPKPCVWDSIQYE